MGKGAFCVALGPNCVVLGLALAAFSFALRADTNLALNKPATQSSTYPW